MKLSNTTLTSMVRLCLHQPSLAKGIGVLALATSALMSVSVFAQTLTESVEELTADVERACPKIWEDLGEAIVTGLPGDIWAGSGDVVIDPSVLDADKSDYLSYLEADQSLPADVESAYADTDSIAANCTAARTALLSKFYSNLPQDVVAAMPNLDYQPGDVVDGFEIGDIRLTGRATNVDGWVFIRGQAMGSNSSSASLKGPEYRELFELAKNWHPNTGTEVWGQNVVRLPIAQSRAIVAHSGASTTKIGALFGAWTRVLNVNNLPAHRHTTDAKGAHTPVAKAAGAHGHSIRTSVYDGSNVPNWGTYFEGKGRPGYESTKSAPILNAPNHTHAMNPVGNHTHTTSYVGASSPIYVSQPSIYFNAEIKYK